METNNSNNSNNNNINNNNNTSKAIWHFYTMFGIEETVCENRSDSRPGRIFSPSVETAIHNKSTESIADVGND
jgi:hypothetical protein